MFQARLQSLFGLSIKIALLGVLYLALSGCANKETMADYDVNCTQCVVKIKFTKEIDDYSLAGIKN